jgi:hypothetical protein
MSAAAWTPPLCSLIIYLLMLFLSKVSCKCVACCSSGPMSPSAFEAHCGASLAKKWRASLRCAEDGSTMESWLAARGIVPPGSRGQGDSSVQRATKAPRPYSFETAWKTYAERQARALGGVEGRGRERTPVYKHPPGRPSSRRPLWKADDLVRLVSALAASESSRVHAQSLTDLLTWAAGQGQ